MIGQLKSTIEEWRSIPGHHPYEASNHGRVRNGKKGNILKGALTGRKGDQYLTVYIGGGRKSPRYKVHRLILLAFIGIPEEGKIACHRNDIRNDNRLDNLYWGTHSENTKDSILNGTHYTFPKGNIYRFKPRLPEDIINNIISEYQRGMGLQKELAKKYMVDQSYISLLVNKKRRSA